MKRLLSRMLDEAEFLSPHGVRADISVLPSLYEARLGIDVGPLFAEAEFVRLA